jgi:hypothetical protein
MYQYRAQGQESRLYLIHLVLDRKVAAPVYNTENTAVGIRHDDHVAPSIRRMLAITSPTSGGRSVSIIRSWTQTMKFSLCFCFKFCIDVKIGLRH